MRSVRRIGWTVSMVLVGALAIAGTVSAQSPSPDTDVDAPVDVAEVLPVRIGAVELALETRGPEEMGERLQDSDDLLMATLKAVLAGSEKTPSISMALASPADPGGVEQYELVALHIAGTDAADLVSQMFRHMMAEQIRARGIDDPDEVERMTAGFESLLPRRSIDGREILSPDEPADATFEFFYPYGEILFIVRGDDGVSMEEVLAALP